MKLSSCQRITTIGSPACGVEESDLPGEFLEVMSLRNDGDAIDGHRATAAAAASESSWSVLSHHGHVLACIAADPDARLRDVAARVGLTERAVSRLLRELEDAGLVTTTRSGRRNHYSLDRRALVPVAKGLGTAPTVGGVVALFTGLRRARRR